MTRLYHFTCSHAGDMIGSRGNLRPWRQIAMPGAPSLVWLTDMAKPDRYALGLTSEFIRCDRTEFRYVVTDPSSCIRWKDWLTSNPLPLDFVSEFTFGRRPRHWWVSETEVPVMLR